MQRNYERLPQAEGISNHEQEFENLVVSRQCLPSFKRKMINLSSVTFASALITTACVIINFLAKPTSLNSAKLISTYNHTFCDVNNTDIYCRKPFPLTNVCDFTKLYPNESMALVWKKCLEISIELCHQEQDEHSFELILKIMMFVFGIASVLGLGLIAINYDYKDTDVEDHFQNQDFDRLQDIADYYGISIEKSACWIDNRSKLINAFSFFREQREIITQSSQVSTSYLGYLRGVPELREELFKFLRSANFAATENHHIDAEDSQPIPAPLG